MHIPTRRQVMAVALFVRTTFLITVLYLSLDIPSILKRLRLRCLERLFSCMEP